jgi:hypothetical protein
MNTVKKSPGTWGPVFRAPLRWFSERSYGGRAVAQRAQAAGLDKSA